MDAAVRHTHDEAEARRLLGAGLAVFGLTEEALAELPKGDARKLALARAIRARTAVPNAWLAGPWRWAMRAGSTIGARNGRE